VVSRARSRAHKACRKGGREADGEKKATSPRLRESSEQAMLHMTLWAALWRKVLYAPRSRVGLAAVA
jgi:hypothetical protein